MNASAEEMTEKSLPIALDHSWRAHSPALKSVVKQFSSAVMETAAGGKRLRSSDINKRELAAEVLVCNMAVALLVYAPAVAVYRSSTATKYSAVLGAGFNAICDAAEALGFISLAIGYRSSATNRAPSMASPTALFSDMLPDSLSFADLVSVPDSDHLDLRSEKDITGYSKPVAIKPTRETERLNKDMRLINELVSDPRITRLGDAVWTDRFFGKYRVWTTRHAQLYRVFNNCTLKHGGRLYGGWWQPMHKADRHQLIRIDNQEIVELDFRNMFLRLAYARNGVAWPFDDANGVDAYTALTPQWNPYPDRYRDGWKTLTNSMLSALKPLRSWPGDSVYDRDQLRRALYSQKFSYCIAAIKAKHSALPESAWEQGLGYELMRTESDIMVKILLECRKRDLLVLPIHDALICGEHQMYDVATVMLAIAERATGVVMPLNLLDAYLLNPASVLQLQSSG